MKQPQVPALLTLSLPLSVLILIVAIIVAFMSDGVSDFDGFTRTVFFVALLVVATASLATVRLGVMPGLLKQYDAQPPAERPAPERFAASASYMLFGFCLAPAVYGLVGSVMTGAVWFAPPFIVFPFLMYALCRPYLESLLTQLSRRDLEASTPLT